MEYIKSYVTPCLCGLARGKASLITEVANSRNLYHLDGYIEVRLYQHGNKIDKMNLIHCTVCIVDDNVTDYFADCHIT
jgi:hypothetical protein